MPRRITGAAVALAVLFVAGPGSASPAGDAAAMRKYVHTYWYVRHHIDRRAAGKNIHRHGPATAADYKRELNRLRRVMARAWSDPVTASWYDDAGGTACGIHAKYGVAHRRPMPCGTQVTMQRSDGGPIVTVTVEDRGPFIAGRTYDLNPAAKAALGCSDLCSVHTRPPGG